MSDKLITQEKHLPLKAYTKEALENEIDLLMRWINNLLGLTGEESAKRLVNALPGIEKHFWSMGIAEIKKAFEMYADGEMSIQPRTNYFDRILVGQIFKEYRERKRTKPETKTYDKMQQDILDAITHYDYFVSNRKVDRRSSWVYLFLQERELIQDKASTKKWAYQMAKDQKVENPKQFAMRYLLRQYFERLEAKGKHLKDLL